MNRWKATGIHFALSLFIAALVGSLIFFIWYPQPYFQIAGGGSLMLLIMSVDVILGPLLTLVVFKTGKKSLRFDLATIGLLQACAFGYGMSVIAAARPVFIVGLVDQFVVVNAYQLDSEDLIEGSQPEFQTRSWLGPRLVGAKLPTSTDEQYKLAISGASGRDVDKFPKYYVPYQEVAASLGERAKPLQYLQDKSSEGAQLVRQFIDRHGGDPSQFAFLPLRGRLQSFAMVISKGDNQPVTALPIDPW